MSDIKPQRTQGTDFFFGSVQPDCRSNPAFNRQLEQQSVAASYVHKAIFWAKSEFVEYVSIDKLGGRPKRTSSRKNVKVVPHFLEHSSINCAPVRSLAHSGNSTGILDYRNQAITRFDIFFHVHRRGLILIAPFAIGACPELAEGVGFREPIPHVV